MTYNNDIAHCAGEGCLIKTDRPYCSKTHGKGVRV